MKLTELRREIRKAVREEVKDIIVEAILLANKKAIEQPPTVPSAASPTVQQQPVNTSFRETYLREIGSPREVPAAPTPTPTPRTNNVASQMATRLFETGNIPDGEVSLEDMSFLLSK